jgi:hypothetical protein
MELKKKYFATCLLFLLFSLSLMAQVKDVPVVTLFDKEYYKYDVKKGVTIFSICRTFNVSEAELLSMNPFLTNGLKAGQTLLIQVKTTKNASENLPSGMSIESSDDKSLFVGKDGILLTETNLPRITLLLPFSVSENAGINDRYVEFYEGFLLAVDSLKSLGLSFEVQALNVGHDKESINQLIRSNALDETDYCIGGVTPEQIQVLSTWSKNKQKIVILPFNSHIPEIDNNPYLFQTITTYDHMYDRLAHYATIRYAGNNLVILKEPEKVTEKGNTLLSTLKNTFKKNGLAYTVTVPDELLDTLVSTLSDTRDNVIIPYQMSINEASRFVTHLSAASVKYPDKKITLIGYPEWQAMNKRYIQELYALNTCLFSSFYADFQSQPVRGFQLAYNKTFGKNLLNTYPKYGLMGYDIASWFIPRLVYEKTNQPLKSGPDPLQNAYQFKPGSPRSGVTNQLFYFINYTPENSVEVEQLK